MTDQKETATTMWQDQHSGKRGHQLMTEKVAETIPALYANEKVADHDAVLAHAKLFSPYSNWTWYITEMDPATGTCFGLVDGLEQEIGYFDLSELAETTVFGDVLAVERDLYWEPRTIGEIKRGSRDDTPPNEEISEGEAMADETDTESQSPDVVNVEEFLFGTAATDDVPADVAEEVAGNEVMDYAGELETAGKSDGDTVTADEPEIAEDGEEQPAPAQTETSDDLKVVLSIRGNRATIGVQRPSADPHIESFDDPDLFGLADEFPAVVARARARWEEEPMHPDYVKSAPPPRQRNRRQQAAAQAATKEGETEAEQQPQPETLRLF